MTTTAALGRLGNQIIRNLAVSFIAEKHDLNVKYCNYELINSLGIELFSGNMIFNKSMILNEGNYFSVYNCENLTHNLDPNNAYFQTKEITNMVHKYLHSEKVKSAIIEKNPFKQRYNANNDLFIHVRLTDVARHNPGIKYFLNTIRNHEFDTLYIATDDKYHSIVRQIIAAYPQARLIEYNEIDTIQFASTCKNIILSHGSFSAVIGYLAFFSKINYAEYEKGKIWYGDMFSIDGWNKHPTV